MDDQDSLIWIGCRNAVMRNNEKITKRPIDGEAQRDIEKSCQSMFHQPAPALLSFVLISVIIPTRNEAATLPTLLQQLATLNIHEVIVVDAHSADDTATIAKNHHAIVITADTPGRARQMNRGAAAATGDVLAFIHADTTLPPTFVDDIRSTIQQTDQFAGGAFRLGIDSPRRTYRLIEKVINLRSTVRKLPYGDQAIFLHKHTFDDVGCYPDIPIMEDYEFMHRLRKLGNIGITNSAVTTSARRWETRGIWKTTLLHQRCIAGYRLGISPVRIATWRR